MEESLKIYRELAQKDPATYLPYVALTRNNLGNLDSAHNLNLKSEVGRIKRSLVLFQALMRE
jgi:hypothetical protein